MGVVFRGVTVYLHSYALSGLRSKQFSESKLEAYCQSHGTGNVARLRVAPGIVVMAGF